MIVSSKAHTSDQMNLDEPGSAGPASVQIGMALTAVILLMTAAILVFGDSALPSHPEFVPFHAAIVLMLDGITAFLLYGQFHYRRLPLYLLLASAYLLSALITLPFTLSFPLQGQPGGGIIGGSQSAIWLWHFWHILFPLTLLLGTFQDWHGRSTAWPQERLWPATFISIVSVAALVVILTLTVTLFHDSLPVLIDSSRPAPLTPAFYWVGSLAALMTLAALILAWSRFARLSAINLWLAVTLLAFFADILASLGAYQRYTVGWYFGRIEAMLASSILLFVFLGEIVSLYRRLGRAVNQMVESNHNLVSLVTENQHAKAALAEKNLQLERISSTDHLTRLPNRRATEQELRDQYQIAERYGRDFCIIMIDIDHFKAINDTHGHNTGDKVLRQLCSVISNRVRMTDFVGRWGGEEFLVICSETELSAATELAERLRELVEHTAFDLPVSLTASFGVSEFRVGEALDDLIMRADQHLYLAKQGGRNRVSFNPEQAAQLLENWNPGQNPPAAGPANF
ncbi:MAG: sensor domain-containing diguanylate cyclase [Candidatus Thiodiazotropha sp.]